MVRTKYIHFQRQSTRNVLKTRKTGTAYTTESGGDDQEFKWMEAYEINSDDENDAIAENAAKEDSESDSDCGSYDGDSDEESGNSGAAIEVVIKGDGENDDYGSQKNADGGSVGNIDGVTIHDPVVEGSRDAGQNEGAKTSSASSTAVKRKRVLARYEKELKDDGKLAQIAGSVETKRRRHDDFMDRKLRIREKEVQNAGYEIRMKLALKAIEQLQVGKKEALDMLNEINYDYNSL